MAFELKIEPEFADAYKAWQTKPDKTTMGGLLKTVQPVIDRGVAAIAGKQVSPVLRSSARQLAIGAIRNYDPARAQLGTHITSQLRGLRRINRKQQTILRVPERVALDGSFLQQASAELEDRLGREPTTSELADHTGLSTTRIAKVRRYTQPVTEGSLLAMQSGSDDDPYLPSVEHSNEAYVLKAVYDDLDDTNQQITEWTLGLYGKPKLSNQQIADRLRITPGAVSQRKAIIQQRLDEMTQIEGGR